MKHSLLHLLLLSAALFLVSFSVHAAPVSPKKALLVAQNVMRQENPAHADKLIWLDVQHPAGFQEIYLFNCLPQGFVMVAADDLSTPVLAYSAENTFPSADMPSHVHAWIKSYAEEIRSMRKHNATQTDEVHKEWNTLAAGGDIPRLYATSVAPLLSTTWNQDAPYNNLCPTDPSSGTRSLVGCVATAMAQIMKYWNHPVQGSGSHSYTQSGMGTIRADFGSTTYDWGNMPANLTAHSTSAQKRAVATLLYHCGVGVEMVYSAEGSGAQIYIPNRSWGMPAANWALLDYFDYDPSTLQGHYKSDYTDAQWKQMLRTELEASRPVLYAGCDAESGHAFVCDGFNANGRFHFNWGWSGAYDGYFAIGSLSLSGGGAGTTTTYSFNLENQMLTGIRPAQSSAQNTYSVSATVNSSDMGSVSGTGSFPLNSQTTLRANANPGYRFVHWNIDTVNPFTVTVTGSKNYAATFADLGDDTLHYDNGIPRYRVSVSSFSDTVFWGIRLRAEDIAIHQKLKSVMLPDLMAGTYTLRIYQGGETAPSTLLARQSFTTSGADTWKEVTLTNPLPLNGSQSLWIIIGRKGGEISAASYSGNPEGCWISDGGTDWICLSDVSQYLTWLIRGVFISDQPAQCRITSLPSAQTFEQGLGCWTMNHGASSVNDDYMGVLNSSSYAYRGTRSFQFCSYSSSSNYNQYLISPELAVGQQFQLSFYYYAPYGRYRNEQFRLMYSTTTSAPSSFNRTIRTVTVSSGDWQQLVATIPADAKYIAINYFSNNKYYMYIDDIQFTAVADDPDSDECVIAAPWLENFTTASPTVDCWAAFDMDEDGRSWRILPSEGYATSYSYINGVGPITPDNWLLSPGIQIPAEGTYQLSWQAAGYGSDFAEHYSIYILNQDLEIQDLLFSETIPNQDIQSHSVPLSEYAGQTVYFVFRHHDCHDQYILQLGNVAVTKVPDDVPSDGDCHVTLPWHETFGASSPTAQCWNKYDSDDDGISWYIVTDADDGTPAGGVALSHSYLNDYGTLTPDNWLVSPAVTIPSSGSYTLSWSVASYDEDDFRETYTVYISTDPLTGFSPLHTETLTAGQTWFQRSASLSHYLGQTVYIAFRHHDCRGQYMLLLDDVAIAASGDNPLSLPSPDAPHTRIYPNPTDGILTVETEGLQRIDLFDLKGQHLLSATQSPLDLTPLPQGTYTLRIITDHGVSVKKVIKK